MAALSDWIRTLILVVLLASFLEMVLPGGEVRKFVRLVVGLLVVLAVVDPLVRWLPTGGAWLLRPTAPRSETTAEIDRWLAQGQALTQRGAEAVMSRYRQVVGQQAASLAALTAGVPADAQVQLDADGRLVGLQVWLHGEDLEQRSRDLAGGRDTMLPTAPWHEGAGGDGLTRAVSGDASGLVSGRAGREAVNQRVRHLLATLYGLAPEQVQVTWSGQEPARRR